MRKYERLADEKWVVFEDLLACESSSFRGRSPAHDGRAVLNGILWVLRAGTAGAVSTIVNLLSRLQQMDEIRCVSGVPC